MAAVIVLFAAVRALLGEGLSLDLLAGGLVAATVVFGPFVALGGAVGVFVGDAATASVGAWTVLDAVGVAAIPLGVGLLWGHAGVARAGAAPRMATAREVGEYAVVTVAAVVTALAVEAWLAPVLGLQPFFVGYAAFLGDAALVAVVGLLALWTLGRVDTASFAVVSPDADGRVGLRGVSLVAVFAVGWYVVGTGIAALTHDVRLSATAADVTADAAAVAGSGTIGTVLGRVLVVLWAAGDLVVFGLGAVAVSALAYASTTRLGRSPRVSGSR
ncbi:hypothetical protein [Halogeometricum limi]|uniref:Uncharacterized protein n=1 Tax=Halogeometricum limi TaxID=555875 RepID=A0A1I6I576_9EURY|nr:hypothetical protein [Halogeometricum limi]SFR61896.1 hypothetical protein SAMN04488124_2848 [Halogeometricum limi]